MKIPEHWTQLFQGVGETDAGDVINIADGEIIGTWSLVDGVFYAFTPLGAEEHLFCEPFLPDLCTQVRDWHEAHEMEVQ
ncbi:hypothetical protein O9X94_00425 [Agrobacterium leguminum]|uniref:Uncharacterized protein n=1 Tax=Agrobacterium leguminum TaxID=2792015 RepID=A0A9X3HHV2_9HYPH|nr:hypothetical protein [Agrobacterium leguminum]MCZ7907757.1 hypothetical protein [Agrobacterium leguminum]